jgi:hypothetical protein
VREKLTIWRSLLTASVEDGRQFLREALDGPIRFTPRPTEQEYQFEGEIGLGRLFSGVAALAKAMASPTGFEPVFWP